MGRNLIRPSPRLFFSSPAHTRAYFTKALIAKKWGEVSIFKRKRLDFMNPRRFRDSGDSLAGSGNGGIDPSDQDLHVPLLVLHLGPEGVGAVSAEVLILIPPRENQEEALPDRNRLATAGTEQLAGLKLVEGRRGFTG